MKIEETEVTKTVKQKLFVAEDGTAFTSEGDCLRHEARERKEAAYKKISDIPNFTYTPSFVDDDCSWDWYFVRNEEEVESICMALFEADCSANEYMPRSYPCWLYASVNDEGYGYIGTHEDFLSSRRDEEYAIETEMKLWVEDAKE